MQRSLFEATVSNGIVSFTCLSSFIPLPADLIRADLILHNARWANGSGLERNRAGNLECVPLECRSALKFAKILDAVVTQRSSTDQSWKRQSVSVKE